MTDETLDFLKNWTAQHDAKIDSLVEGQLRIELRLTSLEEHFKAIVGQTFGNNQDMAALVRRVERIEKRQALTD
jgi:hypothetical protein